MQSIPLQAHLGSSDKIMMPVVGFGTAEFPFVTYDSVKQSVLQAIEVGYRHFDTAELYQTEQALGDAIAEALRRGLFKSRDELFVTSKVYCNNAHRQLVLPALKTTLKKLGLEYLDLYLIHFPASLKPEAQFPFNKDDILPMDCESVWKAMEECYDLGLAKSIGVSNFSCKKIEKLLTTARIPPAVNQVEMNPHWQQKKLKEFCDEKDIHVTAYAPLGAKGTPWGTNRVLECDVLDAIAKAKGKTVAQVCLRWAYQQGVSLVVKSFNKERMKQNLDIFDWKLSAEELEKIAQIPQRRGTLAEMFVTEDGPYKSLMDLWDGEM